MSEPASQTPRIPVWMRTYTPPDHPFVAATADATAQARSADALRTAAQRVPQDQPAVRGGAPADGLPEFADNVQLELWEPRVRMMLAVTEFVRQLTVAGVAGKGNREATVHVGSQLIATLKRPSATELLQRSDGYPGVLAVMNERPDRLDEIQVQRLALETQLLIVMDRPQQTHPAAAELAQVVIEIATVVVQQLKHLFCVPRPHELSGKVAPIIPVPGHSSFPGGHAMQCMAVVAVLGTACGETQAAMRGLYSAAQRVAHNRVVAGLHYPLDNLYGLALGWVLADALTRACAGVSPAALEGPAPGAVSGLQIEAGLSALPQLPLLQHLWNRAAKELALI